MFIQDATDDTVPFDTNIITKENTTTHCTIMIGKISNG